MTTEWETTEEAPAGSTGLPLAEYWAVVVKRRRLIILCVVACMAIAGGLSLAARPAYRAAAMLELNGGGASPLETNAMGQRAAAYDAEFLPTQMRLMQSREVAERVVRRLGLAGGSAPADPDAVVRAALSLQSSVDAQPIRGTNLVELSCVAPSGKAAAERANAFAQAYIDSTVDARLQLAGETSAFLNTQIERLRDEVAQKERDVLAFRRQNDLVSTDAQTNVTIANLDALNADYAAAVRDRVAKEARWNEVQNGKPDAIADSQGDSSLQQLRLEQARLERDYAEKLSLFKPEWPAMVQLKEQIDRGRLQIQAVVEKVVSRARTAAEADYRAALRREEGLKAELRSQKTAVINLNSNELQYSERRLELQTKQALLDSLLKRKAEADVVTRLGGERASYARVVERALAPSRPFSPNYWKNGILGVVAGMMSGLGLALLLSYLDRSLRTSEQVEQLLQLPALGVVPALGAGGGWPYRRGYGGRSQRGARAVAGSGTVEEIELLPHVHPRSPVAECYRAFRAALLLSRAGGVRSIVVTSALPQEGKTVTAANLAIVLSQLGKRVLLVDADLHRPRLHEIFRISNRSGLVSILAEGVPPESAVARTSIPDLYLLPSGPSAPNPSGLLSSTAMAALVERAQAAYDHVIFDTPPILPVADALVVAPSADGVILCVRAGETPRDQILRVRDRMARGGIRILGVLLNRQTDEGAIYRQISPYGYAPEGDAEDAARTASAASRPT
jgi:succinoglycan biosynthesis transport protein ExoP